MKAIIFKSIISLLSTILFYLNSTAQIHFDCINAIEVCDDEPLNIQFENANGTISEGIEEFCMTNAVDTNFLEFNTVWLKYQFVSNGNFLFTISPTNWNDDIDFVAFKSETKNCDELESIRCMFTGENIGEPIDSSCLGATGLSINSTDIIEYPGCSSNDDNFLTVLEINSGDVIYLAVTSYSTDPDYLIEYGGSAIISCEPLGIREEKSQEFQVYPNPTTNEFRIELQKRVGKEIYFELVNSNGKKILTRKFIDFTNVNLEEFPTGIYFVKILLNDSQFSVTKLIKSQ